MWPRYSPPPRLDDEDTVIVDVHEEHEDVQVQLQDPDGKLRWHRRASTAYPDHTACGRRYDMRREQLGLRQSRYRDELCRGGCFTPFELRLADEHVTPAARLTWPSDEKKGNEP